MNDNDMALVEIEDAEIISAEDMRTGFGLIDQGTIQNIAHNMAEHWRGKVSGGYIPVTKARLEKARQGGGFPPDWRKTFVDGNEKVLRPGTKTEKGDLLGADAIRVVQKTLSRGLNPMAHISVWYQNGQLIDCVHYDVIRGLAEQRGASSPEFSEMTPDERQAHSLENGDIGIVAYLVLDTDKSLYLQAVLSFAPELGLIEAKRQALEIISKGKGIGIVQAGENIQTPKGRSREWVAQKRAMTDASRRGFGEMSPAQVAHFASGQGFLKEQDLNVLASPDYQSVAQLPAEAQQRHLRMERQAQAIKAMPAEELHRQAQQNISIMRRNGDDDPLDLSPEDPEIEESEVEVVQPGDEAKSPPADLTSLREALETEAAANPRQGLATEKQISLVSSKLEEVFADDDAPHKRGAVLAWLFQIKEAKDLKFGQAQAILKRLLLTRDEETGDYPLNQKFAQTVQAIYRQTQIELGQLELKL